VSIAEENPLVARDEWLENRMSGIGGSDAAAAIGASPYKSRFELWAEKRREIPAADLSDNEAVAFGHRLEPFIAEEFAHRTGRKVTRWPAYSIARHVEHSFMICTPDAQQISEHRDDPGLLQIKNTAAWFRSQWEEEPPLHVQVQLQHELAVVGAAWGTLVALVGGNRLIWHDYERNDSFIAQMIEAEAEFWALVKSGEPPAVDGSEGTSRAIKAMFPKDDGDSVRLPEEATEWDRELVATKATIKKLEEEKTLYENRIKLAIGEATEGLLSNGTVYSYKTQEHKAYTVEAATMRVLRRKK